MYYDLSQDIRWNIARALGKSLGLRPRIFPRTQAKFQCISLLSSLYRYNASFPYVFESYDCNISRKCCHHHQVHRSLHPAPWSVFSATHRFSTESIALCLLCYLNMFWTQLTQLSTNLNEHTEMSFKTFKKEAGHSGVQGTKYRTSANLLGVTSQCLKYVFCMKLPLLYLL